MGSLVFVHDDLGEGVPGEAEVFGGVEDEAFPSGVAEGGSEVGLPVDDFFPPTEDGPSGSGGRVEPGLGAEFLSCHVRLKDGLA